jgi:RimJ/RimL family protein N-acetyltransferase
MAFQQLVAERIVLRRFRKDDLAAFVAYRNDPEVARYQSWSACSEAEGRHFITEMQESEPGRRGEWYQFAIALQSNGQLIGDCALGMKLEDERQAEIGYTLARAYQKQGYASEAIRTLLGYVFGTLKIHRVIAQVDCRNDPSVALLERLGFRREAHFLQNFWFKGAYSDEYIYALLQAEYRAKFGNTKSIMNGE